jgi:hypothetical protein
MSEEHKTITETRDGRQLEVVVHPSIAAVKAFMEQFKSTRRPAVPRQRKLHNEPFAPVSLARAAKAAQATRSPELLVWVEIEYLAWKANDAPFPLPSARLRRLGVSRKVKVRILRDLERAGLITVEWLRRQAPIVTRHP